MSPKREAGAGVGVGMLWGLIGPKTGSNRAQKYGKTKIVLFGFLNFFQYNYCGFRGFQLFRNG